MKTFSKTLPLIALTTLLASPAVFAEQDVTCDSNMASLSENADYNRDALNEAGQKQIDEHIRLAGEAQPLEVASDLGHHLVHALGATQHDLVHARRSSRSLVELECVDLRHHRDRSLRTRVAVPALPPSSLGTSPYQSRRRPGGWRRHPTAAHR